MAAESLVKPKIYIGGILDPAALARGSWFEKVFYRVIKSNCYKKYLSDKPKNCKINSQSLEDTQVGYISQKYTLLDKYTLEK